MNQSFDTELQVVLRSLEEVVLPALKDAEKHVVEQVHLSMAALSFMRQRLPHAGRFFRGELGSYVALAGRVIALTAPHDAEETEQLRSLINEAQTKLTDPAADWSDYIDVTRRLRAAVSAAVERGAGRPYEQDLNELVIATSSRMHLLTRAWYAPFGFELDPGALPALDL